LEQCTEIQSLERWLNDLQSRRPLSEVERLEQALNEAVRREDYEKAAEVRDALRNLRASPDA
jgi:protein-arginine kinase activator protein McsA